MFVKVENQAINVAHIKRLDCQLSNSCISVTVHIDDRFFVAFDQQAVDIIMATCPSILEGPRLKFIKHAWAVHNLIGHPLLQIFSWLKLPKIGFYFHDNTVPRPKRPG